MLGVSLVGLLLLFSISNARNLNLLIIDWLSDYEAVESYDLKSTQLQSVFFLLAVKHFNEKRVEIYPALSSIQSCDLNLTVVSFCDESGSYNKVSQILEEFTGQYEAIVGLPSKTILTGTIQSGVPVAGYWTSYDAMNNIEEFPLFTNTYILDEKYAEVVAQFVKSLGFSKVALIVMDDDLVPAQARTVSSALDNEDIENLSFFYEYESSDSLEAAMVRVKQTDRNCILFLGWETDISSYAYSLSPQTGLNTTEHVWIFLNTDTLTDIEKLRTDLELFDFFRGSFYLTFETFDSSVSDAFLDRFEQEFALDDSLIPEFNQVLPPHGFKNTTHGCRNDLLNFSLPVDYFQDLDVSESKFTWFSAYDAVMSVGIAACEDVSSPSTSSSLRDSIGNLSFQGLSGRIEYEASGTRKFDTVRYVAYNIRGPANQAQKFLAAQFSLENLTWSFSNSSNVELRGGLGLNNLPGDFQSVFEAQNNLPEGLRILGYFEVAFCCLISLTCLCWLLLHRKKPSVRITQPIFMSMVCLGCFAASFAILPLTVDDEPSNPLKVTKYTCMAPVYLYFLSFQFILGPLIGKSLRAYYIFSQTSIARKRIEPIHVFLLTFVLMSVSFILIVVWNVVDPLAFGRYPLQINTHLQVLESLGQCNFGGDLGKGLLLVLAIFHIFSILLLRYVASWSHRFAPERAMSLALFQTFLVAVPGIVAVFSNVIGRFVLLSTLVVFSVSVTLLFTFLPRILFERHERSILSRKVNEVYETNDVPNNADCLDALRIPAVQQKFSKFAEEKLVTESYLFVLECLNFREEFNQMSPSRQTEAAVSILNNYIEENSFLQVNISHNVRENTKRKIKLAISEKRSIDMSVFDMALKEVADMLNQGAWATFVLEGGMFNIRGSTLGNQSKFLQWMIPEGQISANPQKVTGSKSSLSDLQHAVL